MKKIVLYEINDSRKNEIKNILSQDVVVKFIDSSSLPQIVGDIFDNSEKDISKNEIENEILKNEFMLIDGFDNEALQDLLFRFRSNKVARPITSARTQNNEKWILRDLLIEIFEENEYMMNMHKTKKD